MLKKIISKLKLKPLPNYQLKYFILISIVFSIVFFGLDNDFWFTINQGRYVLEHGFPNTLINSIHNIDFIYQSWGTGVIFYTIYNYFGLYGMYSLLLVVSILTAFFFYKLCFVVSNNKRGSLIITVITMIIYSFYIVTRPHVFTVLNLVIILYLLETYLKTNNIKYLFWLPLISLFQINMHGIYFILLLIIILPYLINSFKFNIFGKIKSDGYNKKPLFIAYLCMILTGFINPYGYKTIIYGFSSYQASSLFNNTVDELLALNFHILIDKVFIGIIIVTYVTHFSRLKIRPIRYSLLLLGTSYLAFDAIKSFYLFLICSFFPFATLYNRDYSYDDKYSKGYHILHMTLVILLCASFVLLIDNNRKPSISVFMDYLDTVVVNKKEMKLFTDYEDGSYAEYRGYYCHLDPRGEVFLKSNNKKEDYFEEFSEVSYFKINYKDFISKYEFDYMLVNKETPLGYLMKNDSYNYVNVKENETHILYKLDREGGI